MNTICKIILGAVALGAAQSATAAPLPTFHCTAEDGTILDIWQGESHSASAAVDTVQGTTQLKGTYHLVTHSIFVQVDEYDLKESDGAPVIINVSHHSQVGRGGCGRAGCPPVGGGSGAGIDASLEKAGQTQNFGCQESNAEAS